MREKKIKINQKRKQNKIKSVLTAVFDLQISIILSNRNTCLQNNIQLTAFAASTQITQGNPK